METLFAEKVRARMAELGMDQQKELALGLAERLGGEAKSHTSKLSRVLGSDEVAERWLAKPKHLTAFAELLEVTEAEVLRWLEASKARLSLVVDPRLDPDAVSALREAAAGTDRFVLVEVDAPADDEVHVALCERAQQVPNPLLVWANADKMDYFAGAGVRASTTWKGPRGWVIREEPDLLPEAEPPAPVLFSEAGERLFPSRSFAEREVAQLGFQGDRGRRREELQDLLARGGSPSFTMKEALAYLVLEKAGVEDLSWDQVRRAQEGDHPVVAFLPGSTYPWHSRDAFPVRLPMEHWNREQLALLRSRSQSVLDADDEGRTYVWVHDDRWFVAGPLAEALEGPFSEHHPTIACTRFELPTSLKEALRTRNLWRAERAGWWKEARRELLETAQIDIAARLETMREERVALPSDARTRTLSADELELARGTIESLARREVRGSSTVPFMLAELGRAELLAWTKAPTEELHVVGHLGRGRVVTLRVFCFEEEPAPLEQGIPELSKLEQESRVTKHGRDWWDGGDVRFELSSYLDDTLWPGYQSRR